MADQGATRIEGMIDGEFAVDFARPLPGAGGGLPAFVARAARGGAGSLMAVQVARGRPPLSFGVE
jgi:eukaryotic-like serine/threonine-protein kinase